MNIPRRPIPTSAGFTLIEVVAVIAVILILAGVVTVRLGDLRSAALETAARALEKEFAKASEQLAAQGNLNSIQGVATNGTLISQQSADPDFSYLHTITYRLSAASNPMPASVANVITGMNSALITHGLGLIRGQANDDLMKTFDANLVLTYDTSGMLHGIYLNFHKP